MGGGMYSTTFYEDHILQYNPAAPLGMLGMAFRQVGGESPNDILTSSTIGNTYFTMSLLDLRKDNGGGSIRPFIHY